MFTTRGSTNVTGTPTACDGTYLYYLCGFSSGVFYLSVSDRDLINGFPTA